MTYMRTFINLSWFIILVTCQQLPVAKRCASRFLEAIEEALSTHDSKGS